MTERLPDLYEWIGLARGREQRASSRLQCMISTAKLAPSYMHVNVLTGARGSPLKLAVSSCIAESDLVTDPGWRCRDPICIASVFSTEAVCEHMKRGSASVQPPGTMT